MLGKGGRRWRVWGRASLCAAIDFGLHSFKPALSSWRCASFSCSHRLHRFVVTKLRLGVSLGLGPGFLVQLALIAMYIWS